ncbi:unnamed protein product, partial [Iphiclides podalirius]
MKFTGSDILEARRDCYLMRFPRQMGNAWGVRFRASASAAEAGGCRGVITGGAGARLPTNRVTRDGKSPPRRTRTPSGGAREDKSKRKWKYQARSARGILMSAVKIVASLVGSFATDRAP